MEFQKIQQFVADYYGIPTHFLEAGQFPPEEIEVLKGFFGRAMETGLDEDYRAYLVQKAIFITDVKKGLLIHSGDTFDYIKGAHFDRESGRWVW